jgi:hypothetical protein
MQLTDWNAKTAMINRESTDIVNIPLVMNGYAQSGKPASLVFTNLQQMAIARFRQHFELADPKDPLFARIMAEIKKICANHIKAKYEARLLKQKYDHLKAATLEVSIWIDKNVKPLRMELGYDRT